MQEDNGGRERPSPRTPDSEQTQQPPQPGLGGLGGLGGGLETGAAALSSIRSKTSKWLSQCRPHLIVGLLAVLLVCAGLIVSLRFGDSQAARLEDQIAELQRAVEKNAAEPTPGRSWQIGTMPPGGCDLEGMDSTSLGQAASGACLILEGARRLMGEPGG